jgi:hypothetical protein
VETINREAVSKETGEVVKAMKELATASIGQRDVDEKGYQVAKGGGHPTGCSSNPN